MGQIACAAPSDVQRFQSNLSNDEYTSIICMSSIIKRRLALSPMVNFVTSVSSAWAIEVANTDPPGVAHMNDQAEHHIRDIRSPTNSSSSVRPQSSPQRNSKPALNKAEFDRASLASKNGDPQTLTRSSSASQIDELPGDLRKALPLARSHSFSSFSDSSSALLSP